MTRYYGCHVSVAGGLANGLRHGDELGVNTIQIHPSPPQRWNYKSFADGIEEEYLQLKKKSGVKKVFLHAIYLINLANPDRQKFHLSKVSLQYYLDLCARIGAQGVIVHVGSNKDQENEQDGFDQAMQGINWVMEKADNEAELLMEVAAGAGKIIGHRMEELAGIYEGVEQQQRVGFALDTQHMWASGYDFENELEDVVEQIDQVFGVEKVKALHLNDSKTELGSRRDRHENLGKGLIGADTLRGILHHKRLKQIPVILETPGLKKPETAAVEVAALRKLLK